ncbi:MAG: HEAT repeat domain-containing protein [Anaerolineae bacterium]|nr:HEAT repeat domain-containing protein [Anaerolineae bacterium]
MSSERWLELLRSYDPRERQQAIRAVAKAKDRRALPQLAAMARDEPDDDIRQLAAKAAHYIRKHTAEQVAAAQAEAEAPAADKSKTGKRRSSRGRTLFERAHKLYLKRKKDEAAAMLLKAVQADSAMRQDPGVRHLAAKIVNAPEDTAVAALQAYVLTHGDAAREARVERLRRIRVSVVVVLVAALAGIGVAFLLRLVDGPLVGLPSGIENIPAPLVTGLIKLAAGAVVGGILFMLLGGFGRRVSRLGGVVEGLMHGVVGGVLGGAISRPSLGGVIAVAVAGIVMLRRRGPSDFEEPEAPERKSLMDMESVPLYEVDWIRDEKQHDA